MKSVTVMLSSYNGEKYIREQINSIMCQKDVNIRLIIRDDGSKDHTIDIIDSFKDNRITLVRGSNIGVINSFFTLLTEAPDTDYYAFSDQDDIWDDRKLYYAIQKMENFKGMPAMCVGSFYAVDQNLNKIGVLHNQGPFTTRKTLVYNAPLGCTEVFNRELFKIVTKELPHYCRMHDHWLVLIAQLYDSKLLYEKKSFIYYRQHEENVVSYKADFITRSRRLLKYMKTDRNSRKKQAAEALRIHGRCISNENQILLKNVIEYDRNFLTRIRFAFNKNFLSELKGKRFYFVLSVLLGGF